MTHPGKKKRGITSKSDECMHMQPSSYDYDYDYDTYNRCVSIATSILQSLNSSTNEHWRGGCR